MQYIWVLWDILAVLIVLSCIYKCAERGFVSAVVRLAVYIAAVLLATRFYRQAADFLYNNVVYSMVKNMLVNNIDSMMSQPGGSQVNALMAIPFAMRGLMGQNQEHIAELPLDAADMLSTQIIETALRTPVTNILEAVSFLLLFALAAWFVRWLSGFFTGINRIPVIGTVNTVLGGITGAVQGVIALILSGFILRLAVTFSGGVWWWLNSGVMESTYIWRHFY